MSSSSDNHPPPPSTVFVRRQKAARAPSSVDPLDILDEASQAPPPRPTSRHSTIADTPLPPPPPPLRDAAAFFATASRTLSNCVAQSEPAGCACSSDIYIASDTAPHNSLQSQRLATSEASTSRCSSSDSLSRFVQLHDMPVGALSSARDRLSNLSNPASSSRSNGSGSASARDGRAEKEARKSHSLQPYIPAAAAAVAAAAAAAADVAIPSVPSLNLANINANVVSNCGPAASAPATNTLSDAAALDQATFLKHVRMRLYISICDPLTLAPLVTVVQSHRP
jgi:hypothetical protein